MFCLSKHRIVTSLSSLLTMILIPANNNGICFWPKTICIILIHFNHKCPFYRLRNEHWKRLVNLLKITELVSGRTYVVSLYSPPVTFCLPWLRPVNLWSPGFDTFWVWLQNRPSVSVDSAFVDSANLGSKASEKKNHVWTEDVQTYFLVSILQTIQYNNYWQLYTQQHLCCIRYYE